MAVQNTTELERVRYWQGQLLASGDLETQLRVDQEMRRLHNRAVHQAYGIAIGLELEQDETRQIKLDDAGKLNLTCGMAYDCAGRELILQSNRAIALPPQFPMTLVLTRDESSVDGITVTWKAPHQVNTNTEVAITTLIAGAPQPRIDPKFREVVARPVARPRLATGRTIAGETSWQPWKIGETEVGVKVLIDTSSAGFTRPPHYFAEVIPGKPTTDFVPAWFASIADPSTQGFTFQLMLRRITREALDIVDAKGRVVQPPALGTTLMLDAGNLFAINDSVARLLPLAENAAVIKTLSGADATLETALAAFTGATKDVAFGNARREAVVKELLGSASFFEATVDHPEQFSEGNVVVRLNGLLENTRPSRVVSVDDAGTLELLPAIIELVKDDTLGIAQPASTVSTVKGTVITVADPSLYAQDDIVVRLTDPIETTAPARITKKNADGTLVLSKAITGLKKGDSLGIAGMAAKVLDVVNNSSELKIEVDNAKQFRKGDLVAKNYANGSFSAPVRVQRVFAGVSKLTLSNSIAGLSQQDTIVAADFQVRATVLAKETTTVLRVGNAAPFPHQSYVARIDDQMSASLPAGVNASAGQLVTLDAPIAELTAGDVIGLCSFPATVRVVNATRDDGSIEVSADLLHEGDLVTALPAQPGKTGLALVAKASGNVIRLAGALQDLAVGDRLSVATIRGVATVTAKPGPIKVEVDEPARLRLGDFLADITGWRQVQDPVMVLSAGNPITLASPLDGLLVNDTVGLASITSPRAGFYWPLINLRLNQLPDLLVGDEVLLLGFDRLQGETQTLFATVVQVIHATNMIMLWIQGFPNTFTFRPEDISASVLFVRGSAMALIQKHDLFVSWLAVGEPDQMPRLCEGTDPADDPCVGTDASDCECSQS